MDKTTHLTLHPMRNMGEIIRELRKRDGITQEKLAECLGISFQSVSKWENGLAWPDLSMVPVLARYFKVSADVLFDMDNRDTAEREEYFEKTYAAYQIEGKLVLRRELMEQREEYAKEAFPGRIRRLCQRVLDECRDSREKSRAVKLLCDLYVSGGNPGEALCLAEEAWDMEHCREVLLGQILSGEEKHRQLQDNILNAVDYAATAMVNMAVRKDYGLESGFTVDEKIEYIMTENRLYETIMPDGNYQFFHRIVGWNHRRLAELYLLKGDRETALCCLLEAQSYDNLKNFRYTALCVDRLQYEPEQYRKSWEGSERGMLLYRLKELEGYFTGSKELEGFQALKERLKEAVQGEKPVRIE